jgi:hypothetical protein
MRSTAWAAAVALNPPPPVTRCVRRAENGARNFDQTLRDFIRDKDMQGCVRMAPPPAARRAGSRTPRLTSSRTDLFEGAEVISTRPCVSHR